MTNSFYRICWLWFPYNRLSKGHTLRHVNSTRFHPEGASESMAITYDVQPESGQFAFRRFPPRN